MSAPVRFSRDYDLQALECPRCRRDWYYLHHARVEVFTRCEDHEHVNKTIVDGKMTAVDYMPNAGSGNPSSRRHGLRIHFWCENCGDGLILNIAQHKGETLFDWTVTPPSGELGG